jgi:hypothetical protein
MSWRWRRWKSAWGCRVAEVPCNGCTRCCQTNDLILVKEDFGDDPDSYETAPAPIGFGYERMVAKAPNGDCIYLRRGVGCTIWERRPAVCKDFDCAGLAKALPRGSLEDLVRRGVVTKAVVERGRELLKRGYRPDGRWRGMRAKNKERLKWV